MDPQCVDGQYLEVLPNVTSDLTGVSFTGDISAFVDAVLERRYPVGGALVMGGRRNTRFGAPCDELFAGNPTSAADLYRQMDTIVHECGHLYNIELSSGNTNIYVITDNLQLSCDRGESTDRGGDTFARSRINGDSFSTQRSPCHGTSTPGCDSYADTYLDGDPDNGTFEGGDQGFNLLFEEAVQYINSLAVGWALIDQLPRGSRTSTRDGLLTFMWYVTRYLHMARLTYPEAYARIAVDPCWRNLILTVWGRAWLFIEVTEGMTALSIDDSLYGFATNPTLVGEIQRLRDLEGC